MKKEQKKYIKYYYGISIIINCIIPIVAVMSVIGKTDGDAKMGYVLVGIWALICAFVYSFYFAIPEFNKNWEKIAGLLFPTILLSLILTKYLNFTIVILINLLMSGLFIWHMKKKTFLNKE